MMSIGSIERVDIGGQLTTLNAAVKRMNETAKRTVLGADIAMMRDTLKAAVDFSFQINLVQQDNPGIYAFENAKILLGTLRKSQSLQKTFEVLGMKTSTVSGPNGQ